MCLLIDVSSQVFHILKPTFFPKIHLGVFAERLIDWKMAQSLLK